MSRYAFGRRHPMSSLLFHSRLALPYEIVLVASNVPKHAGYASPAPKGSRCSPTRTAACARSARSLMDEALRAAGAEYVALAGYMRVLTASFVERWEAG